MPCGCDSGKLAKAISGAFCSMMPAVLSPATMVHACTAACIFYWQGCSSQTQAHIHKPQGAQIALALVLLQQVSGITAAGLSLHVRPLLMHAVAHSGNLSSQLAMCSKYPHVPAELHSHKTALQVQQPFVTQRCLQCSSSRVWLSTAVLLLVIVYSIAATFSKVLACLCRVWS